ncbi:bifunctional 2-C-methyl-D-erythritol 4-phosphate cytidylyltransferase/2-C-methyl-D-erythritol 2,4-cyclodiphosphate synthase [Tepidamorphus sp. 3E244]|uniref:bifunctional 2-C-methyl-D-erythritol 4-phosphate cytidylyltransferase/2-C-methyl-D-erythritol 2,4-cyclodiphosphate synthase n=1 Tax=Tepidamorphus sp. 3E244 TaxID=3385498 RepID=UPI0038FC1ACD
MSEVLQSVGVVIVAAGRGNRARGDDSARPPKQYRTVGGIPVLASSVKAFTARDDVTAIVVVIGAEDDAHFDALGLDDSRLRVVAGGDTRQASVSAGLEALKAESSVPALALIHDAARPFVAHELIDRVIAALAMCDAAIPVVAVTDTLKQVDNDGHVLATADRDALRAAQTPQGFRLEAIHAAHEAAREAADVTFTDDGSIAEWAGLRVQVVDGDAANYKLTTPDDFERAEAAFNASNGSASMMQTRTGQGFDVHRFTDGDRVTLGGIIIPHDRALSGHSDADVVLHAITDAIYGALADGDIGHHFPPSEPQWRGADSSIFLEHAVSLLKARGGEIVLLDATIMCEAPKIGPHRDRMRERIAEIAKIRLGQVAIKATTTEQLGFAGRREGIAAMALATVNLPREN